MIEVRKKVASGTLLRLHHQRRQAVQYLKAGWPVLPGAWWDRNRYRCGGVECGVSGVHVAGQHDAPAIESVSVWPGAKCSDRPYTLLLATGSVIDVLELPARSSAAVEGARVLGVPVAQLPTGRWLLFAAAADGGTDSWAPADRRRDGLLLHGRGSLVPLPPSRLPHGRVRWRRRPELYVGGLVPVADLVDRVVPLLPVPVKSADLATRGMRQDPATAAWARR